MILLNAHCQIDLHSSVWQRAYTLVSEKESVNTKNENEQRFHFYFQASLTFTARFNRVFRE